nr:potassium-transporting ATPase subunit F [Burkholderia sp. BCC0322]
MLFAYLLYALLRAEQLE